MYIPLICYIKLLTLYTCKARIYLLYCASTYIVFFIHACITLICISLLTLYIYNALCFEDSSCIIDYFTCYCFLVVTVSYVVNGEIKRPGRNITNCCIKSWWMIYKVFTFTINNFKECDISNTVVIRYWTPIRINTTVKWLSVVSGNIYCWVWI